jgi:hypothetical protein
MNTRMLLFVAVGTVVVCLTMSVALSAVPDNRTHHSGMQQHYVNSKYGISLDYPKGYTVQEGDLAGVYSLGYLGAIPMEFKAPGGVRVVTVIAPNDSYPDTDFQTAFVTVSVNDRLTRQVCEQFTDVSGAKVPIEKTISGIVLRGMTQGSAGLGHQFSGTYFHGFSQGRCYEFGLGLATAGNGAIEGIRAVKRDEIFAILEHILQSGVIRKPQSPTTAKDDR